MDFHEIWYLIIFLKTVMKVQVLLESYKNNGYFTWRFMYINENIFLISFLKWDFSDKSCRENHILFSVTSQNFCHLWDNVEKYGRTRQAIDDNIIRCMHLAYWITKATGTHREYVILVTFPWQQWFCKHASVLCLYIHIASFFLDVMEQSILTQANSYRNIWNIWNF